MINQNIRITQIEGVERLINTNLSVIIRRDSVQIKCDNKCRLLSHLFHKANLDIHCDSDGKFFVYYTEYSLTDILDGFQRIIENPQWVIQFFEKYKNNEFMIKSTLGSFEEVTS